MASKLRIKVYFADAPDRARSFCLKAFLDSADGLAGGGITTIREARFYLELAPQTTIRVPGCANALIDVDAQRGIQIGRAACRERVVQYGESAGGAVSLKKNNNI